MNLKNNAQFNQNQALGMTLEVRGSDPGSPVEGQFWYRSDLAAVSYRESGANRRLASTLVLSALAGGMQASARGATAASLPANTISGGNGVMTFDANGNFNATSPGGIADWTVGQLVLVTSEATTAKNGLWELFILGDGSNPAILHRPATALAGASIPAGALTYIQDGTFIGSVYTLTGVVAVAVGSDAAIWRQLTPATTPGPRLFEDDFGDGATTSFPFTHSMGTRRVDVLVYDNATFLKVEVPTTMTDAATVTLDFSALSTPTSNQFHVVISKLAG